MANRCQYFPKIEDQYSQAMKQAAKKAIKNNKNHHDTLKAIAKTYFSYCECSVKKAVYHILSELKLERIFSALCFVNTNLPEEKVQVSLHKKEYKKLLNDSSNIFKISNIDCFMEKSKFNTLQ